MLHRWLHHHATFTRGDDRAIIIACFAKYRDRVACAVIVDDRLHSEHSDLSRKEFGILIEEMSLIG